MSAYKPAYAARSGKAGLSAYELAVQEGFVGSLADWLLFLEGADGPPGADGAPGTDGADGAPGADGADGLSAYAVAVVNGFVGTEVDWLASLIGATGPAGADGADGADGAVGPAGADGADAPDTAAQIAAAASKATPADADEFGITDSAAAGVLKRLSWANIKAALLLYLRGEFREKLTAARTYYVRTDGSDSNDGLVNTSGGAFLTIQHAIDVASVLDNGGHNITIQVGAGTFVANNILKSFVGSGVVTITGAGDTTVIAPNAAGPCFGDTSTSGGWLGTYDITSMKLAPTVSGCTGLGSIWGAGGIIFFGNINFSAFGTNGVHLNVGRGALVSNAGRSYTISGGGYGHMTAYDGGQVQVQGATVTLVGVPAFTYAFAAADRGGTVLAYSDTYSGSATGPRYLAFRAGGVLTFGGATYLPGNVAGTATSPGWYV